MLEIVSSDLRTGRMSLRTIRRKLSMYIRVYLLCPKKNSTRKTNSSKDGFIKSNESSRW